MYHKYCSNSASLLQQAPRDEDKEQQRHRVFLENTIEKMKVRYDMWKKNAERDRLELMRQNAELLRYVT